MCIAFRKVLRNNVLVSSYESDLGCVIVLAGNFFTIKSPSESEISVPASTNQISDLPSYCAYVWSPIQGLTGSESDLERDIPPLHVAPSGFGRANLGVPSEDCPQLSSGVSSHKEGGNLRVGLLP